MNWFRRDNLDKKEVRKGKREEAVRPYQRAADSKPLLTSHSSLPSFNYCKSLRICALAPWRVINDGGKRGCGGRFSGMLVVTGNGEEPNRQDENKNADHEKQETVHDYSTPLLSVVAMINAVAKMVKPTTKMLNRKTSPDISCPMTKAARNSFPTSYNAFANSFRCVLSRLITSSNIIIGKAAVKLNFGTIHLSEARS